MFLLGIDVFLQSVFFINGDVSMRYQFDSHEFDFIVGNRPHPISSAQPYFGGVIFFVISLSDVLKLFLINRLLLDNLMMSYCPF